MSALIEKDQLAAPPPPQSIKNIIKSVFKIPFINYKSMQQFGQKIIVYVNPSPHTYWLKTLWVFTFNGSNFKIQINFYNRQETDFIRAQTDRLKIQLSILTKMINEIVLPNFYFIIDNHSGALRLQHVMSWPTLHQAVTKKQNIINMIMGVFALMRRYDELILFLQPEFRSKVPLPQNDPQFKIFRFRDVLKNTKNLRRSVQSCLGDLLRTKDYNQQIFRIQIQQLNLLYITNIRGFHHQYQGLQQVTKYQITPQQYVSQLKQIRKNQQGITHLQNEKNIYNTDKIVFGLLKIQPQKDSHQKLLSEDGAHSKIYRRLFNYVVADTIYAGTLSQKQWKQRSKPMKGQLTFKVCNASQVSINSFKNQIYALTYLRDKCSPFIARYYLMVKKSWNQNDKIYMNCYKQNLSSLLNNNKKLCTKIKIQIAYKIAKGLCFLFSRQLIHRDLKPENIVMDLNLVPKIIDFGSCASHYMKQSFKPFEERLLATRQFHISYNQSPIYVKERFKKKAYDQHPLFDVYGFGKTLCLIFFDQLSPPTPESLDSLPYPDVQKHILFLIQMCLNADPDDRPGFGQLTSFIGTLKQLTKNVVNVAQQQRKQQRKQQVEQRKSSNKSKNKQQRRQKPSKSKQKPKN